MEISKIMTIMEISERIAIVKISERMAIMEISERNNNGTFMKISLQLSSSLSSTQFEVWSHLINRFY